MQVGCLRLTAKQKIIFSNPTFQNWLNATIVIAKESLRVTQKSSREDNYTKRRKRATIGGKCDLITESLKTIRSRCATLASAPY